MMNSECVATIISESAPYQVAGKLLVREFWFEVPLDHTAPHATRIRLFARSAVQFKKPITQPKDSDFTPYLVFLQGGPGFGNPAPQDIPFCSHFLDRGYQLLLVDYRGTGNSSTVSSDTLRLVGGPDAQARYLRLFRADSIVRDLEAVRLCLTKDFPSETKKWSILGQSFGGMTSVTYLSLASHGLREAFITGGLPPLDKGPDDVYRATYERVIQRNDAYYRKFPMDIGVVKHIASYIRETGGEKGIALPAGGRLTVGFFMGLGLNFGGHGGLDRVHGLVVKTAGDLTQYGFLTRSTLQMLEQNNGMDGAPLYALLHEPCWIYGPGVSSDFAADRIGRSLKQYSWLQPDWEGPNSRKSDEPLYFLGEMVPSFLYDTVADLQPLRETAVALSQFDDWSALYDKDQLAHRNEVPVYAAIYADDMYVDARFSRQTAAQIRGAKFFETNVLFHNALRSDPDAVLKELFRLRDDTID